MPTPSLEQPSLPQNRIPVLVVTVGEPDPRLVRRDSRYLLFLSDDGSLDIDGVGCKRLKDPAKRRFRAYRRNLR